MRKLILFPLFVVALIAVISLSIAVPPPPPPTPEDGFDESNLSTKSLSLAACNDNIKNQNETDIDCGWECSACAIGKSCLGNADCSSNYCNPTHKCAYPSCGDGWLNGNESNIDCGANCKKCNEEYCENNSECTSNYCSPGMYCSVPSCDDSWKNGYETGIDCGGNCKPCANLTGSVSNTINPQNQQGRQNNVIDNSKSQDPSLFSGKNINAPGTSPDKTETLQNTETVEVQEIQSSAKEPQVKINFWISLALFGLLVVVLGVGLFWYNRLKSSKAAPGPPVGRIANINYEVSNQNITRLSAYISSTLKAGYSPQAIRQELLKNEWKEQDISLAFNKAGKW